MRGLQEIVPIQDTFCSGIGAIERLEGDLFRFWMYVNQASEEATAGGSDKILVAKIVISRSVIPNAILQTIAAITENVPAVQNVAERLN